jgi:HK97 family phage major capsid protein
MPTTTDDIYSGGNPLAPTDNILSALRAAHEAKRREASERWATFETVRRKAIESGTDLTKDHAALRRLDDAHKAYKATAEDLGELQERLFDHMDGKATGGIPSGEDKGIPGLGAEFLRKIGAGTQGLKALDGTSGGSMVGPFYDPRIRNLPQRALFVRSLIPVRQIDSDKVWYLRQTVATQSAAPVAAGAVKPTSVYTIERIEEPVRTLAHVTEALDRALLSDFDALVEFLDNQLRLGVLLAEEAQIINGSGVSPNLRGILNTSGIQTQARGTDPHADAIYKAMVKLRLAFFEPDGICLHPSDWQTIRLTKTADGEYQTAPVTDDGVERLFGKPVIQSPVIAQGTGLVGAFAVGSTVWDRESARITFTESGLGDAPDTEMFTRNQVRFRGEERIAFGVERPAAFCSVSGL